MRGLKVFLASALSGWFTLLGIALIQGFDSVMTATDWRITGAGYAVGLLLGLVVTA